MPTIVVRYQTGPDQADENQRLVEAVYAELAAKNPEGFRYATLRLADCTFLHIAEVTAETNPLEQIAAFGRSKQRRRPLRAGPGTESAAGDVGGLVRSLARTRRAERATPGYLRRLRKTGSSTVM